MTWLDANSEVAAQKYEVIRAGLIRMFISHGLSDAEGGADIVINRVITRLPDIISDYKGKQERYFHGVARKVLLEWRRRKEVTVDAFPELVSFERLNRDAELGCLNECLELLTQDKRELMLDYYLYEKKEKIHHHKLLAEERGTTENALRGQVHRLRIALQKCVLNCMKGQATKTNGGPLVINNERGA